MFESYRRYSPDSSGLSVVLKKQPVNASDVTSPVYLGGLSILCSKTSKHFTGVAQRQRDGLITRRSHDRNVSPVFYNSVVLQKQLVNASDSKQAPCYRCGAVVSAQGS